MSFRFTLDNIQKNDAGVTSNDADLLLLQTTTDSTGTLADLIGNIPVTSFPGAIQNSNVTFSGDHKDYTSITAFNSDTTTLWDFGDTATIVIGPHAQYDAFFDSNSLTTSFIQLQFDTTSALFSSASTGAEYIAAAEAYVDSLSGYRVEFPSGTTVTNPSDGMVFIGNNRDDSQYTASSNTVRVRYNVVDASGTAIVGALNITTVPEIGSTGTYGPIRFVDTSVTASTTVYFYTNATAAQNPGNDANWLTDNFTALNSVAPVSLNSLTDATISSPAMNQILQYNGTAWVNVTAFGVGDITSTNASYMIATSDPGTAAAATYNAASFQAITGGGATTAPSTIPSTHVLYYNGLALIPGTDYTLASDGSSIEVNATAQGEFVTGSVLNLVTTTLS